MSVTISKRVWATTDITGGARLVLLCIANYADDSGFAWPSVATIARETCISERHVTRILKHLVQSGAILMDAGNGRGNPSAYMVLTGCGERERAEATETFYIFIDQPYAIWLQRSKKFAT